jgi:DNA polymerase-3 subunit delta'
VNRDEALFFDLFVLLMRLSYMRKIKDMSEWADQVASWGRERQKLFLDFCQRLVRENFIYNFRRSELNYMSERESEFAVKFARFINERNVYGIMDELSAARRDIEQNVNPRMVFFDFALKMIVLLIQ